MDHGGARGMIALILAAMFYWFGVCGLTGVAEPWDSAAYWGAWYPLSLVLSGAAGAMLGRRGWAAGVVVTGAQLPVMGLNAGTGMLWAAGLAILGGLAIPAVMAAAAAGRWAVRRPRA